jgi:hypothetical protein
MRDPTFFIVGAPKCGTTSLAAWLAAHPSVFMSAVKEPAHFAADLKPARPDAAAWQALFAGAEARHLAVGEASTCYVYSRVAIPAIVKRLADARFIVCLRNPIDMARSLHRQELFDLNEDVPAFEDAWQRRHARAAGRRIPRACTEPWLLQYEARCRLGEQVARLLTHARRDHVHFVVLDDLHRDPRAQYVEVLRFLGVPDDGQRTLPALNRAAHPRSRVVKRAVRSLSSLRMRLGFTGHLGLRPVLERWNTREAPLTPVTAGTREELRACFAADVRRLGRLIGRDLTPWLASRRDDGPQRDRQVLPAEC